MTGIRITNTVLDYNIIAELADVIWREHYTPIIGEISAGYMVTTYQSVNAISEQVTQGTAYYLITFNNTPVGYFAIKPEDDALFLSKFYVLSDYRGKKIGKTGMEFIVDKAKLYGLNRIKLIVNVNNANTIKVYEKFGFVIVASLVSDFGKGFLMDDYQMEKSL